MTTVLTKEKEKEIVDRLGKLKYQIAEREKILGANKEIRDTRSRLESIKTEIQDNQHKISKLVKELKQNFSLINTARKEISKTRKALYELRGKLSSLKETLAREQEDYKKRSLELRDLSKVLLGLKQKEGLALKVRLDSKLKEQAQKIYERFKNGEKLSTEDLLTLQRAGFI
jgi:uncharacterized coiled-coil DUF342 family protein